MKQNQIYTRIILDNNAEIIKKNFRFALPMLQIALLKSFIVMILHEYIQFFLLKNHLKACYFEGERKHTTQNMQRFQIRSLRFFLFVCFSLSVKVLLNVTKIKRLHNSSYQIFLETVLVCVFVELYREIRDRQIM